MGDLYRVAGAPRERLIVPAIAAAISLSLLFVAVYSSTNWLTAQRSNVGSWQFEWERAIPFVPLMVIPYMSIDLFFVAAPFLCRDRRELATFTRRTSLAIIVAGICFLAMPLQLAQQRPPLEGWLGMLFGWFFAADLPYNLLPSLHIALRTILAETYARHTRNWWNLASHVWFSLIGFSTLLTYQHHVVDVAGGFVLALLCFYAVPAIAQRQPVVANRRIGGYYSLAAVGAVAIVVLAWPWGALAIWPGAACALAAAAYFGLGPGIYRKMDGRLPLSTHLLLAPLIAGQALSLRYYRRQCQAWDEVMPGIWIGRRLTDREAAEAMRQGVTAVLDLTAEFSEAKPFLAARYLNVPILDLTAPTPEQLERCLEFLNENDNQVVYVHCKIGYSRSAAVIGAYLLLRGIVPSAEKAIEYLRAVRPSLIVRPEAAKALHDFAARKGPASGTHAFHTSFTTPAVTPN